MDSRHNVVSSDMDQWISDSNSSRMVSRVLMAFLVASLLYPLVSCSSIVKRSVEEAMSQQARHTPDYQVKGFVAGADTVLFKEGQVSYDRHDGSLRGVTQEGQDTIIMLASGAVSRVISKPTALDSNFRYVDYRQFLAVCNGSNFEQTYGAHSSSTNMWLEFKDHSGRLWAHNQTLTGKLKSGECVTYALAQIDSVKVKRHSRAKTALLVSGILLVSPVVVILVGSIGYN